MNSKARLAQGFTCVKMNATEDVGWLDMPSVLDSTVERLKAVKALGLNVGLDFHGRLHKPMAKQLAKALVGTHCPYDMNSRLQACRNHIDHYSSKNRFLLNIRKP